ncbi:hypothetical protein ABEG17_09495 [Pedococcus sp. KACC 23699]|uniref:Uncharacterized protein n=1 Tax=Pedococcus sp. KACC 23699 TaxID=3149228 RepID=A0AAU7JYN2_9MICO
MSEERFWPAALSKELDEADQLEQAHPVVGDPDEGYPPDPG